VTPRWVKESLEAGKLQSLTSVNNRLIYRPLPFPLPLAGMESVRCGLNPAVKMATLQHNPKPWGAPRRGGGGGGGGGPGRGRPPPPPPSAARRRSSFFATTLYSW